MTDALSTIRLPTPAEIASASLDVLAAKAPTEFDRQAFERAARALRLSPDEVRNEEHKIRLTIAMAQRLGDDTIFTIDDLEAAAGMVLSVRADRISGEVFIQLRSFQ